MRLLPVLGVAVTIIIGAAWLLRRGINTRSLPHRYDTELTAINALGEALKSAPYREALLEAIYQQITRLMEVPIFLVALVDRPVGMFTFPLAMTEGKRTEIEPCSTKECPLLSEVLAEGKPLLIPEGASARLTANGVHPQKMPPVKSLMVVPLMVGEHEVGAMAVGHPMPHAFGEHELRLLDAIGALAAISVRNLQLFQENRAREEYLKEVGAVSALINASLDPEAVLDAVLEAAMRVSGCQKVGIFLEEDGYVRLVKSIGLSDRYVEASQRLPIDHGPRTMVMREKKVLVVPDIVNDPRLGDLDEVVLGEGFRSFADVPMLFQDECVGHLTVYYDEPHYFSGLEIEVLNTLANQAATALVNARLYEQADEALAARLAELSAIEAISRQVSASLDLDTIIREVLDAAVETIGADSGSFSLISGPDVYTFIAYKGRPDSPHIEVPVRWPMERGVIGRVLRTGKPALVDDVSEDPDYYEFSELTRSELCVPVRLRDGAIIGAINLESRRRAAFTQMHLRFLENLADHTAIAIENARLFEELKASHEHIEAILNSTRDGVLVFDTQGILTRANPAAERILGLEVEPFVGRSFAELLEEMLDRGLLSRLGYTGEDVVEIVRELKREPDKVARRQFTQTLPEGQRFIEEIVSPVLDGHGDVIGRLIVWRDITELKELEKYKEEFTNMIVHDLRSPLSSIIEGLRMAQELLQEEPEATALLEQVVDISLNSAEALLNLVESLLDISKLEAGKMPLQVESTSLHELVADVVATLEPLAQQGGIEVKVDIPDGIPAIKVDPDKMHRVLVNLLDNALRHTPTGGEVRIAARQSDGEVLVSVTDTGPGIAPADRERVFDKFVQLSKKPVRGHRGSGLGLAFCKLAVEAHGGRIWVEEGPEGGASFVMAIPAAAFII